MMVMGVSERNDDRSHCELMDGCEVCERSRDCSEYEAVDLPEKCGVHLVVERVADLREATGWRPGRPEDS